MAENGSSPEASGDLGDVADRRDAAAQFLDVRHVRPR